MLKTNGRRNLSDGSVEPTWEICEIQCDPSVILLTIEVKLVAKSSQIRLLS